MYCDISIHTLRVERDMKMITLQRFIQYFNPLSPSGERRRVQVAYVADNQFQSTLSEWRETVHRQSAVPQNNYFNPLSPSGERLILLPGNNHQYNFNPLSPSGERLLRFTWYLVLIYFNPLSPSGERLVAYWMRYVGDISIRSLRVEGDLNKMDDIIDKLISIHPLRVEGDFVAGR